MRGLKIWIILLVAICCSLVVLAILLVSRRYMKCGGERTGDHPLDFEATQGSEVHSHTLVLRMFTSKTQAVFMLWTFHY